MPVSKYPPTEEKYLSIKYIFRADIKYFLSVTDSAIDIGKALSVCILTQYTPF
jgi:hypothetical protein